MAPPVYNQQQQQAGGGGGGDENRMIGETSEWGQPGNISGDEMWGDFVPDIFGTFESSEMDEDAGGNASGTVAVALAQKALQAVQGLQGTTNYNESGSMVPWSFGPVPNPAMQQQQAEDEWNFVSQLGGTASKRPRIQQNSMLQPQQAPPPLPHPYFQTEVQQAVPHLPIHASQQQEKDEDEHSTSIPRGEGNTSVLQHQQSSSSYTNRPVAHIYSPPQTTHQVGYQQQPHYQQYPQYQQRPQEDQFPYSMPHQSSLLPHSLKETASSSSILGEESQEQYASNDDEEEKKKERESICRDRNREYARNTRLRKKAYVRHLEDTVKKMRGERDIRAEAQQRDDNTRNMRRRCLETFLDYRARGEVSEDAWADVVDPQRFELWLPVTPYRSYNPCEVIPSEAGAVVADRRVCRGISGVVFDTASFAVMLQSIGVPRRRGHKLVACSLELVDPLSGGISSGGPLPGGVQGHQHGLMNSMHSNGYQQHMQLGSDTLIVDNRDPARIMGAWRMRTRNAVDCGAASECDQRGFLIAVFDTHNRLRRLDMCFDALGFIRQLQRARGVPWLEVVPNTLPAALKDLAADDASYNAAYAQRQNEVNNAKYASSSSSSISLEKKSTQKKKKEDILSEEYEQQQQSVDKARSPSNQKQKAKQSLGFGGRHITISSLTRHGHFARPKVVTLADRPHLITHVNRDFLDLAGLEASEAIGRSLRIIQGPATDTVVVEDMLADVARRIPTSMIVVNYTKSMERFINYLRVFPLFDPSTGLVTHYFGELERVDDDTVRDIEHNSPNNTPVWRLEDVSTMPPTPFDPGPSSFIQQRSSTIQKNMQNDERISESNTVAKAPASDMIPTMHHQSAQPILFSPPTAYIDKNAQLGIQQQPKHIEAAGPPIILPLHQHPHQYIPPPTADATHINGNKCDDTPPSILQATSEGQEQ